MPETACRRAAPGNRLIHTGHLYYGNKQEGDSVFELAVYSASACSLFGRPGREAAG